MTYRELLANPEIDAVIISTPDHQHARLACAAIADRKDVYLQKPSSLTIAEGRTMVNHVNASSQILQIGSQQRSWKQFARACELVRNGRIGEVQRVEIGLPGDPAGGDPKPMPIPAGFDYDPWFGSTPDVYYTLDRTMQQMQCSRVRSGLLTRSMAPSVTRCGDGRPDTRWPVSVWAHPRRSRGTGSSL